MQIILEQAAGLCVLVLQTLLLFTVTPTASRFRIFEDLAFFVVLQETVPRLQRVPFNLDA